MDQTRFESFREGFVQPPSPVRLGCHWVRLGAFRGLAFRARASFGDTWPLVPVVPAGRPLPLPVGVRARPVEGRPLGRGACAPHSSIDRRTRTSRRRICLRHCPTTPGPPHPLRGPRGPPPPWQKVRPLQAWARARRETNPRNKVLSATLTVVHERSSVNSVTRRASYRTAGRCSRQIAGWSGRRCIRPTRA